MGKGKLMDKGRQNLDKVNAAVSPYPGVGSEPISLAYEKILANGQGFKAKHGRKEAEEKIKADRFFRRMVWWWILMVLFSLYWLWSGK